DPSAAMPTDLPLRSAMLRMSSFPKSSKQPTCTPVNTVTGPPPSITDTHCGAKCILKSTLPLVTASLISALDFPSIYWISVKPSARKNSLARNWGAWQIDGVCIKRTEVVSSGSSAAAVGGAPSRPVVPASDNVAKKRRLVWVIGIETAPSRFQLTLELVQE